MIRGRDGRRFLLEREAHERAVDQIRTSRAAPQHWDRWVCPECGTARDPSFSFGLLCPCEEAQAAELEAEYTAERKAETVATILEDAGIPRRFRDRTFESFAARAGTEDALNAARAWADDFTLETETGLLLAGPFGCGKTHLATAALRVAVERTLVEGRWISAGELVSQVRSGNPITWTPVENAIEAELLLLDDLGQEVGTDFTRDVAARVVMARYDEAKPTLFTSNQGPKGLEAALGGAIVSRVREMAETIPMSASDYRSADETPATDSG